MRRSDTSSFTLGFAWVMAMLTMGIIALTGCAPEQATNLPEQTTEQSSDDTEIVGDNPYGDDVEQVGDNPYTDDTGYIDDEPVEDLELEVAFTTAWSAAVPFRVGPAQQDVNFGAWIFGSITEDDIDVTSVTVMSYVDADGDGIYHAMEEDGISATDYLENCRFTDTLFVTEVVMGPMDPGDFGALYFTDDFVVGGEFTESMNLKCDISPDADELSYASFAWDIQVMDVRSTADITWHTAHNVDHVDGDGNATVTLAAYITNE